jgi:VWFA-related protein
MNRMPILFRAAVAGSLLLSLMTGVVPAAAQAEDQLNIHVTQVDTSNFPVVKVFVSVTDAGGEPVPVDAARLEISEDGRTIRAQDARGVGESDPLTTMLVIDISGSMQYGEKLPAAKTAALAYVDQMRPWEKAGLISFNTVITEVQPVTEDHGALKAAIEGLQVNLNDTAMYDALAKAVETLKDAAGRKAVIVLTDGMDNKSVQTAAGIVSQIGPAGLSISTVALGDPAKGAAALSGVDESALRSLAGQAGGEFGYANDAAALSTLYQQLGRALHSEYVITYTSPSSLRDGVSRALSVGLGAQTSALGGSTSYNPGGVVPEVEPLESWPLFFILLVLLLALLMVPGGVLWVTSHMAAGVNAVKGGRPAPAAARIHLKTARAPRIKLR